MALNKENTSKIKERFTEFFEKEPFVLNENKYGCDGVSIEISESINFDELKRLKEGVHNTMTLSVSENGLLKIAVW